LCGPVIPTAANASLLGAKKVSWFVTLNFETRPPLFKVVLSVLNSTLLEISSTKLGVSSSSFSQLEKMKIKRLDKIKIG
jgi:hypothetical protein